MGFGFGVYRQQRQGNWKLALKVGKTATLGFSNALWTNSDLLNAGLVFTVLLLMIEILHDFKGS